MYFDYNMTKEEYNLLYKRYLKRSSREMLELAGMKEGYRVLDICAGSNGRATKEAILMGASYVMPVDLNPYVKSIRNCSKNKKKGRIEPYCGDIEGFLQYAYVNKHEKFDIAICQQGINYWFKKDLIRWLRGKLKNNGVFVFNTFNKCPSVNPTSKTYDINGKTYTEVVWLVSDTIKHIQIMEGKDPHYTEFMWLSKKDIRAILDLYFNIEIKNKKTTDIYVCKSIKGQ